MAGTYNRNTYNSALYNAGRDDAGAVIRSIISAHTGPHIQAVVGADPTLPDRSGISFISDFTIIEGPVRKPPLCYNFPDLRAVMRAVQVGTLDLPTLIRARQFFDLPASTYPVAFLPDLNAFIFALIEADLPASILGELAKLDLAAIIQIVQEDLKGIILGIAAPNLGGRVFSQLAPNLGAIIWSPHDLPAFLNSVNFLDLPTDIFSFRFSDLPASMLGIASPELSASIKGFASVELDLPSILSSRMEKDLLGSIIADQLFELDLLAQLVSSKDLNNLPASLIGSFAANLKATIGLEVEVEFNLQAILNFLSAINLKATIGTYALGSNDKFLAGILQSVHESDLLAVVLTNDRLKNLSAVIQSLSDTSDLSAFLRVSETFVTTLLTISTLNASDLRATIGNPGCAGGSLVASLAASATAQHASDFSGFIQSFVELNLGASINQNELFYAMDSIGVTFTPKTDRPVRFLTSDTIGVTFSPFRGLNLRAIIQSGLPNIDMSATINAVIPLLRVEPSVSRIDALELRSTREFDTQEIRLQLEGELLDYFYVNGTDDAFIRDGNHKWKINIRSFREITAGLFGDFAAGRVCRLGNIDSYASMDEAVRSCIAAVIGLQGETDMTAQITARGGVVSLPASLEPNNTFGDLSAVSNRVFPSDLSANLTAV